MGLRNLGWNKEFLKETGKDASKSKLLKFSLLSNFKVNCSLAAGLLNYIQTLLGHKDKVF